MQSILLFNPTSRDPFPDCSFSFSQTVYCWGSYSPKTNGPHAAKIAGPHARQCVHFLVSQYGLSFVAQCCQIAPVLQDRRQHARQCAFTCPHFNFRSFVAQCCQIAGPQSRHLPALQDCLAACLPLCTLPCLPICAFMCLRAACSPVGAFLLVSQNGFTVGAWQCSLLAHKRAHQRRARVFVFTVGAGRFPCQRIKMFIVRGRRICVPTVTAHECSLSAHKCGAHKFSLLAHKRIHRRRTKVFLAGAQACSRSARKSVPCRRTRVSLAGAVFWAAPQEDTHTHICCWLDLRSASLYGVLTI